jgi:hypothetical protein
VSLFTIIHHHHHHHAANEVPPWAMALSKQLDLINERLNHMATQAQLAALQADVAALITEAVADITAAVAAAQAASPDPAIDTLDTNVKAATQTLKDAAAKLSAPPPT